MWRARRAWQKYQEKKRATLALCKYARRWIAERTLREAQAAALLLQRHFRRVPHRRAFLRKVGAALRLQARFRGRKEKRAFLELKAASVLVQRSMRKVVMMARFRKLRRAAMVAQLWWRCARDGKRYKVLRVNAIRVQTWFRCHVAKRRFVAQRRAALLLQTRGRMRIGLRTLNVKRVDFSAARKLQSRVRGRVQKLLLAEKRKVVIMLQNRWRGGLARQGFRALKTRRKEAVTLLQAHWRGLSLRIVEGLSAARRVASHEGRQMQVWTDVQRRRLWRWQQHGYSSTVVATHVAVEESSTIQLTLYFPASTRVLSLQLSWIEQMGALWSVQLFAMKKCTLGEYCEELTRILCSAGVDNDNGQKNNIEHQARTKAALMSASALLSQPLTEQFRLRSKLGSIKVTSRERVRVLETSLYSSSGARVSTATSPATRFQHVLQSRAHVLRYALESRLIHRRLWSETQTCLHRMEEAFCSNFCVAVLSLGQSSQSGERSAMELLVEAKSLLGISRRASFGFDLAMSALRFLRMAKAFKVAYENGAATVVVKSESEGEVGGGGGGVEGERGTGTELPLTDVGSDLGARVTTTPQLFKELSRMVAAQSSYTNEWRPTTFALAVRDARYFLYRFLRDLDSFRGLWDKARFARETAEPYAEPAPAQLHFRIVQVVGDEMGDDREGLEMQEETEQGTKTKESRKENEQRSRWWTRVMATHRCSELGLVQVDRERELSIRRESRELWECFLRLRSQVTIELSAIPRDSLEVDDRADAAQAIGNGMDAFATVLSQIGLQFKLEEERFVERYNDIDNIITESREGIQALRKESQEQLDLVDAATEKREEAAGMLEMLAKPKQEERPDVVDGARKIFYESTLVSRAKMVGNVAFLRCVLSEPPPPPPRPPRAQALEDAEIARANAQIDHVRECIMLKEELIRACFDSMSVMEDLQDRMEDARNSLSPLLQGLQSQQSQARRRVRSALTVLLRARNERRRQERVWFGRALDRQLDAQEGCFTRWRACLDRYQEQTQNVLMAEDATKTVFDDQVDIAMAIGVDFTERRIVHAAVFGQFEERRSANRRLADDAHSTHEKARSALLVAVEKAQAAVQSGREDVVEAEEDISHFWWYPYTMREHSTAAKASFALQEFLEKRNGTRARGPSTRRAKRKKAEENLDCDNDNDQQDRVGSQSHGDTIPEVWEAAKDLAEAICQSITVLHKTRENAAVEKILAHGGTGGADESSSGSSSDESSSEDEDGEKSESMGEGEKGRSGRQKTAVQKKTALARARRMVRLLSHGEGGGISARELLHQPLTSLNALLDSTQSDSRAGKWTRPCTWRRSCETRFGRRTERLPRGLQKNCTGA